MRRLMKKLNLMSPVKLTGMITLLACLFFLAGAAGATAVYDNLSIATGGPWQFGPNNGTRFYDSFSTGAGGYNLGRVELLVNGSATSTGSFTVDLYSDNSTKPGSLLTILGTVNDNAFPSTGAVATFNLSSPYALAANTRYWIEIVSNNSAAAWDWAETSGGVGVAGEYWGDNGGDGIVPNIYHGFTTNPFQMQVSDVCSVPLPPSVWLLGSGLVGLIGFRRFRRS
ncbi:MAG: choice-of-anchor R domain-containing protein [Desulfobaccales bacterium]